MSRPPEALRGTRSNTSISSSSKPLCPPTPPPGKPYGANPSKSNPPLTLPPNPTNLSDVAGTVIGVGSAVTRFKLEDRVVAIAMGITHGAANSAEGAFKEVVLLRDHMAAAIPDDVMFEEAAAIPLGVSTATCGLYQKDHLAMAFPRVEDGKEDSVDMGKVDECGCKRDLVGGRVRV